MGFNYGLEKKRFEAEWTRLRKEYAEAGMEAWAIEEMYNFDLLSFRRRRVESLHEQSLSGLCESDGLTVSDDRSPLLLHFSEEAAVVDTYSYCDKRFRWIDTISDQELYERILLLSHEEKIFLTMLVEDQLSQADIARVFRCSRAAITKKIKKIKKLLENG